MSRGMRSKRLTAKAIFRQFEIQARLLARLADGKERRYHTRSAIVREREIIERLIGVEPGSTVLTFFHHHVATPIISDFRSGHKATRYIDTPFGKVTVTNGRGGCPYIRTRSSEYPGSSYEPTTYEDILKSLRMNDNTDQEIALALRSGSAFFFPHSQQKRAAATLTAIVSIAEDARKIGAAKLFRSALNLVASGSRTFDDIDRYFPFATSAKAGKAFTLEVRKACESMESRPLSPDKDSTLTPSQESSCSPSTAATELAKAFSPAPLGRSASSQLNTAEVMGKRKGRFEPTMGARAISFDEM